MLIDAAFCLLLDKRADFWPELNRSFSNVGITLNKFLVGDGKLFPREEYNHIDIEELPPIYPTTNMYPSWTNKPNAYNAFLSHRKILEYAYVKNLNNIMIVEDDVKIEDDFTEILSKATDFLDTHNVDMLYLGAFHHNNTELVSNNVLKLKQSGGFHAVIISKKIIKLLLSFLPLGPYDWLAEQYIQEKYDCYAIYPSIVSQKDGYSFVESSNLTKPSRYDR